MYVGDEEFRVCFADKSTHFHSPLGICQALPSTCALSHVIPLRFFAATHHVAILNNYSQDLQVLHFTVERGLEIAGASKPNVSVCRHC